MKNHLLEKLHPNFVGGTPLNIFKILKNLTEKSYGAFKIWRQKNSSNFSFFLFLINLVKLLIQEVLVLLNNYSRILVLLNNYFSFFEFWSNLVKLWSNCGQTVVKQWSN